MYNSIVLTQACVLRSILVVTPPSITYKTQSLPVHETRWRASSWARHSNTSTCCFQTTWTLLAWTCTSSTRRPILCPSGRRLSDGLCARVSLMSVRPLQKDFVSSSDIETAFFLFPVFWEQESFCNWTFYLIGDNF